MRRIITAIVLATTLLFATGLAGFDALFPQGVHIGASYQDVVQVTGKVNPEAVIHPCQDKVMGDGCQYALSFHGNYLAEISTTIHSGAFKLQRKCDRIHSGLVRLHGSTLPGRNYRDWSGNGPIKGIMAVWSTSDGYLTYVCEEKTFGEVVHGIMISRVNPYP